VSSVQGHMRTHLFHTDPLSASGLSHTHCNDMTAVTTQESHIYINFRNSQTTYNHNSTFTVSLGHHTVIILEEILSIANKYFIICIRKMLKNWPSSSKAYQNILRRIIALHVV
jgi:hypothetical protein